MDGEVSTMEARFSLNVARWIHVAISVIRGCVACVALRT
jgi:hypothetical protein